MQPFDNVLITANIIAFEATNITDLIRFREVNQVYKEAVDSYSWDTWARLCVRDIPQENVLYLASGESIGKVIGFAKGRSYPLSTFNINKLFYTLTDVNVGKWLI